MLRIKLVVPIINNFKQAIEMLASAKTQYNWTPLIVPQWELHWPLAQAWNYGIHHALEYDYALIVNDDILFHPQTIDNLVKVFEASDENVLMVTALNQRFNLASPDELKYMEVPEDYTVADSPDFSCFMVRPSKFIEVVGQFDCNFRPAYFEDNDMHRRIGLAGHRAITTTAAPYYHYGSQTQNNPANTEGPIVSGDAFNRNAEYYASKWGGTPGAETWDIPYNHPDFTHKDWHDPSI